MHRIEFSRRADRDLDKLGRDVQRRLLAAITALANDPRPHGVKKLTDTDGYYRIRVGDYRVIYTIRDDELVILVVGVGERNEIYRRYG